MNHDVEQVEQTVIQFSREFVESRLWQLGQIKPGLDATPDALALGEALYRPDALASLMQPNEWLRLALYGAGLCEADAGEMHDVAQSLAEWLFAIPGHGEYAVPDAWADTPMGALWWAALIRAEGDELITLSEAAETTGMSLSSLSQLVSRRKLRGFTNPAARNPMQGRTLVRRSDVLALGNAS